MDPLEKRRIISIIAAWTAVVVLAALLGSFLLYHKRNDEYNKDQKHRLEREVLPLKVQKTDLLAEKNRLDREMLTDLGCAASVGITLLDIDSYFVEFFYSEFTRESWTILGTLCLSKEELPGMEGKISLERFNNIIGTGWGVALLFESTTVEPITLSEELDAWLTDMRTLTEELGIAFPKTVLFDNEYYLMLDDVLSKHGIKIASHRAEDGLPAVELTAGDGIWHPGMVGWADSGAVSNMLYGVTNTGGYFSYTVGVGETRRQYDRFDADNPLHTRSVTAMASRLSEGVELDAIKLLTYEDGYEFRRGYLDSYQLYLPVVEERKTEIDKEIAVIDRKILDVYKKYGY